MKRMHVHIRVNDLPHNIRFYSALFNAEPAVVKGDYAKWMLDDPRINFAISTRAGETGLDHLGFQVDDEAELQEMQGRLLNAELPIASQTGTSCCYAKSDKHWTIDPQGIAWESYRTLDSIPTFNDETPSDKQSSTCCAPAVTSASAQSKAGACGSTSTAAARCC